MTPNKRFVRSAWPNAEVHYVGDGIWQAQSVGGDKRLQVLGRGSTIGGAWASAAAALRTTIEVAKNG